MFLKPIKIKNYSLDIPKTKNQLAYEVFKIIFSILIGLGSASFSNYLYFQFSPLLGVPLVGEVLIGSIFFAIIYFIMPFLSKAVVEDIQKIVQQLILENVAQITQLSKKQKGVKVPKIIETRIYPILLDTSVIIDGRFRSLVELKFVQSQIIVPQFVIAELHSLSDSRTKLKRDKGRRGLQILEDLKNLCGKNFQIYPSNIKGDVDSELIKLAKKIGAYIATVDFNLAKVAQIKNIKVLNINKLALSLKTTLIPGDNITLQISKIGSSSDQGVGYLEDGTMIVVKGASNYVNKYINVTVSKVIQKESGKIIFADITTLQ